MKQLFFFTIALISLKSIYAQDKKPTKEATVNFINTVLNSAVGVKAGNGLTLISCEFTYNSFLKNYSENEFFKYPKIDWGACDSMSYEKGKDGNLWLTAHFKNYVREVTSNTDDFVKKVLFLIPDEKAKSIDKAFLRLCEIAKEENKDPFTS